MPNQNAAIYFLRQRAIDFQLIKKQYDSSLPREKRDYGLDPALIAQAQLMQDERGLMLVVTPRDKVLSEEKLQQQLQRQLKPADELLIQQLFHCDDSNAIAPLPLITGLRSIVDNSLSAKPLVCFEVNTHNMLACVSNKVFMQLHPSSQWADISEPRPAMTQTVSPQPQSAEVNRHNGSLQQRLLTLRELPPADDLTTALLDILKNPKATVEELAAVIETDPSLTAQTLRHARSPYYGYSGRLDTVADAITSVLGFDTVLSTALAIVSNGSLQIPREGPLGKETLSRHSVYSAMLAKSLSRYIPKDRGIRPGTAYLAALLQNMGFLLLGHLLRPDYQLLCQAIEEHPTTPLLQLEDETLGVNHTQIGTWLMRSWNMPDELTIAMREHHNTAYQGEHHGYVQLIALVNALLKQHGIGDAPNDEQMDALLKSLHIPEDQAHTAVEVMLSQQDALDHLASSLSA